MKVDFVVSFVKNTVPQARIVKAENAAQAQAYFEQIEPEAEIYSMSVDDFNLAKEGCPVEEVPDGWKIA